MHEEKKFLFSHVFLLFVCHACILYVFMFLIRTVQTVDTLPLYFPLFIYWFILLQCLSDSYFSHSQTSVDIFQKGPRNTMQAIFVAALECKVSFIHIFQCAFQWIFSPIIKTAKIFTIEQDGPFLVVFGR